MGIFYNSRIVKDGLVLCLDAANRKSYPGTGTTWFDISGNQKNFVLTNGPLFQSSNKGSIYFDGMDDYASIVYNDIFNGATFSIWFKTNNTTSYIPIMNKGYLTASPTTNNGIVAATPGWSTSTILIFLNNSTGSSKTHLDASITQDIRDNKWHNLIITYNYDGAVSTLKSYLDGNLRNTSTLNENRNDFFNLTQDFYIGSINASLSWDGQISQFLMYNKALSNNEIIQNYNALRGRYDL